MNLPDKHIQNALDRLVQSTFSFAIYRLPWTEECHFVLQVSDEVERLENIRALNGKKGFVLVPFRQSETHPLVLIRPDAIATGWADIEVVLAATGCAADNLLPDFPSNKPILSLPDEEGKRLYADVFGRFIVPLREKRFRKLVLSRASTRYVGERFSPFETFLRACNNYPRMLIYLCHTPVSGTWMGSTPEILLSGHGEDWHTVALAGTLPMRDEAMPTEWDRKNREEQECVADYLRAVTRTFGSQPTETGPYTARAGQLAHLKTDFRFRMKHPDRLGDLLHELHPTPAVCGLPKEDAFRFISEYEGYDRAYYSGFIGWLDPDGQTDLYVNLRCMEVKTHEVTLYAGGGLLSSSEMEAEWEETDEKMQTMERIIQS